MGHYDKIIPEGIFHGLLVLELILVVLGAYFYIKPVVKWIKYRKSSIDLLKIPLLKLFERAEEMGAPITEQNMTRFINASRQAAFDNRILLFGRVMGKNSEDTAGKVLEKIPQDHWKDYKLELRGVDILRTGALNMSNSDNQSITTIKSNGERSLYRDIHVEENAIEWLKNYILRR